MHTVCRHFEAGEGYALARAAATAPGGRFQLDRTVLLAHNVVVDVFRCSAPEPAVFDLPMHLRAAWDTPPEGIPVGQFSEMPGYRELRKVHRIDPPVHWHALRTDPGRRLLIQVLDDHAQLAAVSPGYRAMESLPMLLRRAEGSREAYFVTAIHLLEEGQTPETVSLMREQDFLTLTMPGMTLTVGTETVSLVH